MATMKGSTESLITSFKKAFTCASPEYEINLRGIDDYANNSVLIRYDFVTKGLGIHDIITIHHWDCRGDLMPDIVNKYHAIKQDFKNYFNELWC